MTKTVISVEHLTKRYDLGVIGTGTVSRDLNRWWARLRKQPDPYLKIGQADHGNRAGESILALDNVSFTVEQGEVLGIIGRNGAGKSTLLKILSQVTAPTSGKVKVKGRIGSLLEVGTGFHPELTGRENVYLNGAILGMTRAEVDRKFDEIVDFSGVEKFIDTPVKRYSSGMYVRLAFAVAAHLEPEILIVDEVLAVGDAEFQKKCLGKMGDVAHEGRTVLFVSHNMKAIENLCNTCLYIETGKTRKRGDTNAVINLYLNKLYQNDHTKDLDHFRITDGNLSMISAITSLNGSEEETRTYKIGDDITFEVKFKVWLQKALNPVLGIGIHNSQGIRVFTMITNNASLRFENDKVNKIKCTVFQCKLMPGMYYAKIALQYKGFEHDVVDNYPIFEIVENNYYGTGKLPFPEQGVIVADGKWELLSD